MCPCRWLLWSLFFSSVVCHPAFIAGAISSGRVYMIDVEGHCARMCVPRKMLRLARLARLAHLAPLFLMKSRCKRRKTKSTLCRSARCINLISRIKVSAYSNELSNCLLSSLYSFAIYLTIIEVTITTVGSAT